MCNSHSDRKVVGKTQQSSGSVGKVQQPDVVELSSASRAEIIQRRGFESNGSLSMGLHGQ